MAKRYGNWEVVKSLRPGGQAETFLVVDHTEQHPKDQQFVLKRLRNPERHERFKIEIEALTALNHPHVVRLIDSSIDNEPAYLVMEYCAGGSLADHPERWSKDPVAALKLFAEVCDGVSAAHALEVTHRDIKPENILLRSADGPAVVGDFGIAYIANGERLTLTDEAVGARRFTPPELADGRADLITTRSDVYSLGKLLYWMLAGGRIFDREQHRDLRYDLARGESGHSSLEHVNRLLDNMIALDPAKRYGNASIAADMARFAAQMLTRDVRVLAEDLPQECSFCRYGHYKSIDTDSPIGVSNFGITPVASSEWRILVCDHCGNIQLFRPDHTKSKKWWGPTGGINPVPR